MPNESVWDAKIGKANTQTIEYEKRYTLNGQKGTLRLLGFLNNGKFGNYDLAIAQNPKAPNMDTTATNLWEGEPVLASSTAIR
ncbi:hypothetical protein [Mucilaginibacter sp. dw_454]|uniref:hypothetical protein n=1 Tax=Mucilaginibacter sp. dw_454 TaxID=2720079 RepID=UPI001BD40BC2|nr:hypothetical protein [Mucilaginibacter sp. dw_454]